MTDEGSDWLGQSATQHRELADSLLVEVDGYEGPLDLLLEMARRQKVDLAAISILQLAEQYLEFVESARQRRIEIAADYLVMAAWLAYLKSRLMVPQAPAEEELSGEMMAALLQFRLRRLEAMRRAATALFGRPQLNQAVFARGQPEALTINRTSTWEATLYDLLKAYAHQRERRVDTNYQPIRRTVWSLQEAHELLDRLIGASFEWVALDSYLEHYLTRQEERAMIRASSFSASLEMVRQGELELRQDKTFGPLFMRRKAAAPE
ncbi:segregation/condensation protein A [Devosia pacifica]|uniref:Segregation and condensation protein A n=1 Tax=Devosia pacifica TaxID=1335967 RepID=A0A918RSU4_9HYPH|nr:ScpA family protein [Devosia pacifica]GHA10987.1 segregation/condensation protein A [Devosia pacifica]